MRRLFPNDDPIHLNLDALMPEGQHTPTSLHKSLTAPPAADAQPQTSPGPEVLQAPPNAAMYSGLLAVIKPYAETHAPSFSLCCHCPAGELMSPVALASIMPPMSMVFVAGQQFLPFVQGA